MSDQAKKRSKAGWRPLDKKMSITKAIYKTLPEGVEAIGFRSIDLFKNWPDIVGEHIAERARPYRFRDGRLILAVESPAWANELSLMREEILAHINERAPAAKVTELAVEVRKLPKKYKKPTQEWKREKLTRDQSGAITVAVSSIKEKSLRKTLESFFTKQAKWIKHHQPGGDKKKPND